MFKNISIPHFENASMLVFWLIVINLGFNVLSNASFRVSAEVQTGAAFSFGKWSAISPDS